MKGLGEVNVGTIEDYQGMERRIILLSTVRASSSQVPLDVTRGLGVIQQRKRLNVALTRAMALLVIVGDPETLCLDQMWRQICYFCTRHGLFHAGEQFVPEAGAPTLREFTRSNAVGPSSGRFVCKSTLEEDYFK